MNKETMMNNIIKKFGFESDITISFCKACECEIVTYKELEKSYNFIIKNF